MIDDKIKKLRELTSNWLIIEFYTHTDCDMYKIKDEFTHYNENKLVLCPVTEGIEEALDLALEHIGIAKANFFGDNKEKK